MEPQMCGVAGFFVGCEFASICNAGRPACALIDTERLIQSWYQSATVRRSPRRLLAGTEKALFPEELAPVLRHGLVQALDQEQITGIQNNHLFRYLDFTAKLEIVVVNDVVKDISFNQLPVAFDRNSRHFAHQVYVDEAYHALFSIDLLNQASDLTGMVPVLPEAPRFLNVLRQHLEDSSSERERRLKKLFFVIVSETLITSSLTDLRRDGSLPKAVRSSISDHAIDEVRHQTFFAEIFAKVIGQLTPEDRIYCLKLIPDFVMAFVSPDTAAIEAELQAFGLDPKEASAVVSETYTPDVVSTYARSCSEFLFGEIKTLDEFDTANVQDAFGHHGVFQDLLH